MHFIYVPPSSNKVNLCSSYPDPDNPEERKELVVKLCTFHILSDLSWPIIINTVSQDPSNYQDAPTEGIRRILEIITGEKIPRGQRLETDKIGNTLFLFYRVYLNWYFFWRLHSFIYHRRHKRPSWEKGTETRFIDHQRLQGASILKNYHTIK